jgi:hypothetical protein
MFSSFRRALVAGAAVLVAGCAGTEVGSVANAAPDTALRPPRTVAVVIEDDGQAPERASHRERQDADARETAAALTQSLSALLGTRRLVSVPPGRRADLTLYCHLLDVRDGNTALRTLVGFGAGKAVLRVGVALSDTRTRARSPLLRFETDSTTGGMPGAGLGLASGIGGGNALALGGAAAEVPGALTQGLAREVAQTTTRIDEQLGLYFAAQHWPYVVPVPSSLGGSADRL